MVSKVMTNSKTEPTNLYDKKLMIYKLHTIIYRAKNIFQAT